MRRCLALIVTTIAALAPAGAAHAAFFAAEPVDGPTADIVGVGDLDVARDGSGVVTYVRRVGPVDHIWASRLVSGSFQPVERLDGAFELPGSQPAAAASDGGRLVVAFVSGGALFVTVRPAGAPGWTAPQLLASTGESPSVDMSINGVAYVTFTSNGDVRAARLDRGATAFTLLDAPLDINQAAAAGVGTGRSRVAVAADGTAVAVWGESGRVFARRLFGLSVSSAPVELTVDQLDGHPGRTADAPDVDIEDDSSFAWITFRERFDDGAGTTPRALAVRLRGSRLEAPVAFDGLGWGGAGADVPDIDLNGRGEGLASVGTTGGGALAGVLKDDMLNGGVGLGGSGVPAQPLGAVAETTDRVVGWMSVADAAVHARYYDDKPNVRTVPGPGADVVVSNPALGPVDVNAGFDVAGNRIGDFSFVFVQGTGADRRLVAASYDRPPGGFRTFTSSRWRNVAKAPLAWGPAPDLWGPLTYTVLIDGKPVATTQDTKTVVAPSSLRDGLHSWRVVATDRHAQTATTPVRPLRTDAVAPRMTIRLRRTGPVVTVTTRASDVVPPSGRASGLDAVRIDFGDGTRAVEAATATHRYGRGGTFVLRVTAADGAANATVVTRTVHIGG